MLSETGSFSKPNAPKAINTKPKVPKYDASSEKKSSALENAENARIANRKSHNIVMDAISSNNTEMELKLNFKYIYQEQLDDIAEERSIYQICGYPLCMNEWKDEFGQSLYIIRRNSVYDISLRKFFCSNKCFHAYEMVRSQIPQTPLYLRNSDDHEFVNLQISFPDLSKITGKYGNLIDISSVGDPDISNENSSRSDQVNLNSSFECASLPQETDEGEGNSCAENTPIEDIGAEEISKKLANVYINPGDVRQDGKPAVNGGVNKAQLVRQKLGEQSSLENAMIVEQRVKEMMSFETLNIILGETYLRGMVEHLCQYYEDCNIKGSHQSLEAELRYANLCRKMEQCDVVEEIDKKSDEISPSQNTSDYEAPKNMPDYEPPKNMPDYEPPSENMPDYEQLKKETANCTIKINSFITGDEEKNDSHSEIEDDLTLPLIDSYAITAWRRKIFFDKLYKYLPHHIRLMNLYENSIATILRPVIYSLDLSPHNIYFSPSQWSLVCLIFLKMLSIRYEVIDDSFQNQGKLHVEAILGLFGLDNRYLDRVLPFLTDLDYILAKSNPNSTSLSTSSKDK